MYFDQRESHKPSNSGGAVVRATRQSYKIFCSLVRSPTNFFSITTVASYYFTLQRTRTLLFKIREKARTKKMWRPSFQQQQRKATLANEKSLFTL